MDAVGVMAGDIVTVINVEHEFFHCQGRVTKVTVTGSIALVEFSVDCLPASLCLAYEAKKRGLVPITVPIPPWQLRVIQAKALSADDEQAGHGKCHGHCMGR
jgi:hypothetical protein